MEDAGPVALRSAGSLAQPIPAELAVRAGRDQYLTENGFTVAAYSAPFTPASFLGLRFSVPNTERHKWAIKLHDLHHVATGYGTDIIGEAEISAWEARRGVGSLGLYVGAIVVSLTLFGIAVAPRRTIRAWRASGANARSLFGRSDLDYEALLVRSIGDLRDELRIPRAGVAQQPRRLHTFAPIAD